MSSTPEAKAKMPLDAAIKIVTELAGMTPEQQSLALKFAMETLGLQVPKAAVVAAAVLSSAAAPQQTTSPPSGTDHSTNIRSFTEMKAPKSDQQFTAVVAYFYQFESKSDERKDTIDAVVMKEAARLAGRAQVARWNMTLTNAKNAGYLDSAGSGKFKLSSVGENLVAITLPGSGTPAKASGAKKKPKKTAKKATKKKR